MTKIDADVILLTASWCGGCNQVKKLSDDYRIFFEEFKKNSKTFKVYDIDKKNGKKIYKSLKLNAVPCFVLNGKKVDFNQWSIGRDAKEMVKLILKK